MSDKKKSKPKIEDIMREYNDLLIQGIELFDQGIDLLCDHKIPEFNKVVDEIIAVEKKADRVKDQLIEEFMKRETMAFSRMDRIELLEKIDVVHDLIEYTARTIQTHPIKSYEPVSTHFKQFTNDLIEVVKALAGAVNLAEDDLQKTIEATRMIEELRRAARNHSFEMMRDILKAELLPLDKFLFYSSTEYMLSILDCAEEASDFLRTIAIKYLVIS
jgi:predicted phosphate transport protein (TIGR00153 family)